MSNAHSNTPAPRAPLPSLTAARTRAGSDKGRPMTASDLPTQPQPPQSWPAELPTARPAPDHTDPADHPAHFTAPLLTADEIEDGESEHLAGYEGVRALTHPHRYRGAPAERPLLPREQLFVQEYMVDMNASAAAGRAGYRCPAGTASRLIRRPNVTAAISRAMDARAVRVGVTADRVLQELAWISFSRLTDVVRWGRQEDGRDFMEVAPSEVLAGMAGPVAALAEVRLLVGGGLRVRMHDKLEALTLLARHLGLLRDKLDLFLPEPEPAGPHTDTFRAFLADVPREMRDKMRALILEMEAVKKRAEADRKAGLGAA
jgi:phage terminase small subunit